MSRECDTRGGCVYVKVRADEETLVCKDCGQAAPVPVELNEGDEGKK